MNTHDEAGDPGEHLWFMNTWVTIRRPSSSAADGVSIIEHHMPYGDSPPLHVHHDEDEVFHVLEGAVRVQVGGNIQEFAAGQTFVAPRGTPHTFKVTSPEGLRCLTLTFGAGFETLVREFGRPIGAMALPPAAEPTPEMIASLTAVAGRNGIDILGPPLA